MKLGTINKLFSVSKGLLPIKGDTALVIILKVFAIITIFYILVILFPLTLTLLAILFTKDFEFKNKKLKIGVLVSIVGLGMFFSVLWFGGLSNISTTPSQHFSESSKRTGEEDISDLLSKTKSKIVEFNKNLTLASNYNIDITQYEPIDVLGITDSASSQMIEDTYNQINSLNENLLNSIEEEKSKLYKVISVTDGDTIKITYNNIQESVRLIGMDTPETVHPTEAVQCFGVEASLKMRKLVEGKDVRIMFDSSQGVRDKYGRLLLYIWVGDIFVNKQMIEEGYAHEYTYSTPYIYQNDFKNAENKARESKKGLWGDICACEKKEISRSCTSCNTSTITYQNWDCSTFTETESNNTCTNGCKVSAPVSVPTTTSSYSCNCSKTCTQISTCAEAYYQLNTCGCSIRDRDHDGVPCEDLCN